MTKYIITTTHCAIHRESVNPIYGEGVLNINLQDDAAGFYFEITSNDAEDNKIKCDLFELKLLLEAGEMLIDGVKKVGY